MSSNESHAILRNEVYYDPAGYGSITSTCKEAFQKYKTTTLTDVYQWFNFNLETTKQVKSSNSIVAPCPHHEYQLELMFSLQT